eukprot:CAMPEP_0182488986 /NCGR_PEP_ID=MMETSP1319-20130603/48681_1 /TAXON_ID=172717 /ORGANISM="Bolidomonas pacifica, Strain RCC208" /LENGTH=304 /DNA_ID=CAMNT_0024691111 /DNA_START=196 /DNA_END=1109 /DNA_ORIENTATION=+
MNQGFLMSMRIIVTLYLFVVGFLMEWTPLGGRTWDEIYNSSPSRYSDDTTTGNAPQAYLTNWGFISVLVYFSLASFLSITNYTSQGVAEAREPKPASPPASNPAAANGNNAKFSPLSVMASSYVQSRPSTIHAVTWYFFTLAATVQPFIVLGFWVLVFPYSGECNYQCGTVHGAAFVCIYVELVVSKLTIDNSLLFLVLAYPSAWVTSQLIWIHLLDLQPDYQVLPMDNWASLFLSIGSFVFFLSSFFVAKAITARRDRRWAFAGGVSGRGGPPASKYFAEGVMDSDDEGRSGLLVEEGVAISF